MIPHGSMVARRCFTPLMSLLPKVACGTACVIASALAGLTGCKRSEPDPGPPRRAVRVAVLVESTIMPMRNYQTALLERLIRTRPRTEVSTLVAGDDANVQARHVREAADGGAEVLMIFPKDAAALAPALREVMGRGVKVIAFSPDVPEDACTSAVFTDERKLGQLAGEHVVAALKTKAKEEGRPAPTGRVVMLRGDEEGRVSRLRAEGFVTAIQSVPGIVLVHDAPANWNERNAADRTREALRLQKQFDVIYAQNDLIAAGASRTVRESNADARESMLIVGTDGALGPGAGLDMVLKGEIEATLYQPPLVDLAWEQAQALIDTPGASVPKRTQVKPFMITPDNALAVQEEGLPVPEVDGAATADVSK